MIYLKNIVMFFQKENAGYQEGAKYTISNLFILKEMSFCVNSNKKVSSFAVHLIKSVTFAACN